MVKFIGMSLDNLMGLSETTLGQVNYREDLYRKVQHCDFLKKLCVTFLSKFQNPASITLCINVLSVYPAQNYCISPKFLLDTSSQGSKYKCAPDQIE